MLHIDTAPHFRSPNGYIHCGHRKDWLFLCENIAKSLASSIYLDNFANSLPSRDVIQQFTETSLALKATLACNCFLIGLLGKCRQDQQVNNNKKQQHHFIAVAHEQYISEPISEVGFGFGLNRI